MVLFLHNRYRTTGGEERVVDELLTLVRDCLGEPAELLERDSAGLGRARAAAGLLHGGITPRDVAKAVRMTGARVVHAHNLHPTFGWRALAAARSEGAHVVLHLHQYRLVCATGVCFTGGRECTRCHGRNTLPGVIHNCRGSRSEALAYGASLALWQRRLAWQADVVIVPSVFARERLRELGAPLDFKRVHVLAPPVRAAARPDTPPDAGGSGLGGAAGSRLGDAAGSGLGGAAGSRLGDAAGSRPGDAAGSRPGGAPTAAESLGAANGYALVVSRLAPEKGVDVAIDACRLAGVPLVIAGEGPELDALRARAQVGKRDASRARGGDVQISFVGHTQDTELDRLRAGAALAIVPSRSAETFGMAAAEAMAEGVPVLASRVGALPELVEQAGLVEPGDAAVLAEAIGRRWGDAAAGARGRARVRDLCAPGVVADGLRAAYDAPPAH